MIVPAIGTSAPSPIPCSSRNTSRLCELHANAQNTASTPMIASDSRNVRRRPTRSLSRPTAIAPANCPR